MRQNDMFFFFGKGITELEHILSFTCEGYEFVHKSKDCFVKHTVVLLDGKYHHDEYRCKDSYGNKWMDNAEIISECIHADAISDEIPELRTE